MASAIWNTGLYKCYRCIDGLELQVVAKYALRHNIDIEIDPRFGSLTYQTDKWRKKFTKYVLNDEEKAFMKTVYFARNEPFKDYGDDYGLFENTIPMDLVALLNPLQKKGLLAHI